MIKIIPASFTKDKKNLLVDKRHLDIGNYFPINITHLKDQDYNSWIEDPKDEFLKFGIEGNYYVLPLNLDMKEILSMNSEYQACVLGVSRNKENLPLKEIKIMIDKGSYKLGVKLSKNIS